LEAVFVLDNCEHKRTSISTTFHEIKKGLFVLVEKANICLIFPKELSKNFRFMISYNRAKLELRNPNEKGGTKMEFREKRLTALKRNIENLRNEMVLAYVKNGDMRHAQVLEISQLLDEELNRYAKCQQRARAAAKAGHRFVYHSRRSESVTARR